MERKKYNFSETKQSLREMATMGSIKDLIIRVKSQDHFPVHFHVIKKGEFEAKVELDSLEIIGYVFRKSGKKLELSDLNKIKKWLKKSNKINPKITNFESIELLFKTLNPDI